MAKAPEWVKDAFYRWVETWGWETKERNLYPYKELVMDVGEERDQWELPRLLGKLWHCNEPMNADLCERLDLPPESTYAQAAQKILMAGRRGKFHIPRSGFRVPPS